MNPQPHSLRRRLACVALGSLAIHGPGTAGPATGKPRLLMVNTVYPPFVNPAGNAAGEGLDVEIAREALARAGYDMELALVPWRRALLMLEHGKADLISTISRRDDRDKYLDWSVPYRLGADYRFYSRRGTTRPLRHLDDLKGQTLGAVAGFHYPPPILHSGAKLYEGRDVQMLVKMLHARRIEHLVATGIAGAWEIRSLGLDESMERQPLVYKSDSPNYLAVARSRPGAMAALPALSKALEAMRADGSLRRLEQRYRVGD